MESGIRKERARGVAIDARVGSLFGRCPERRHQVRAGHARAAREDVVDDALTIHGQLEGLPDRTISERTMRAEAEDVELLRGGVEDVELIRIGESIERAVRAELESLVSVDANLETLDDRARVLAVVGPPPHLGRDSPGPGIWSLRGAVVGL